MPNPRSPSPRPRGVRNITPKGWQPSRATITHIIRFLRRVSRESVDLKLAELERTTRGTEPSFHIKRNSIRQRTRVQFHRRWMSIVVKVALDRLRVSDSWERNKITNLFTSIFDSPSLKIDMLTHAAVFGEIETILQSNGIPIQDFLGEVEKVENELAMK